MDQMIPEAGRVSMFPPEVDLSVCWMDFYCFFFCFNLISSLKRTTNVCVICLRSTVINNIIEMFLRLI